MEHLSLKNKRGMKIVCNSHRVREKLFHITGEIPGFWAVDNKGITGEDIYLIPIDKEHEILSIKGIKKFSEKGKKIFQRW